MAPPWAEFPSSRIATNIDHIGEDLLQNIVTRLPALSFASAACVNRSWNLVCNRVLCRPKLSSACLANPSLHVAIEGVVMKVLSEPIRPHFAIAYVAPFFNLQEAHQLITAKLGSNVPVVTTCPAGIIGRYEFYDKLKETRWDFNDMGGGYDEDESASRALMLIVGFLPGIKVRTIPLVVPTGEYKFVTDIREFSTSISGCNSPAAIIMFSMSNIAVKAVMELMDYFMSPETVIVGDCFSRFWFTNGSSRNIIIAPGECISAVALVFVVDRKKPLGIGETQFHAVLSSGLVPVGSVYAVFVKKSRPYSTKLTGRREGSGENLYGGRMFRQACEEEEMRKLRDLVFNRHAYIGVTKRRKYSEKAGWGTSLAFHKVLRYSKEDIEVGCPDGIETGDIFRFYQPDSATALSSIANVSSRLRSFKQGRATGREVFGGLMFTSSKRSESFLGQPNVDSSPFLDHFPGITFGGMFCHGVFGRADLTSYDKESQEQKLVHCRAHDYGVVYLIMTYAH